MAVLNAARALPLFNFKTSIGERKQVTVLCADARGSMELAEQLDPEEWHTILDRFFVILAEGVQSVHAGGG